MKLFHVKLKITLPTTDELAMVHAQLQAMHELGCGVSFKMEIPPSNPDPIIKIKYKGKDYNFSDPDYHNVFGDLQLIQNALFFDAGFSSNDKALKTMARFCGLPMLQAADTLVP